MVQQRDGGRGRGRRRDRDEPQDDTIEKVVAVSRVAKVVKGGRRFSFTSVVVVGDGAGRVGIGIGRANEVPDGNPQGLDDRAARHGQRADPQRHDSASNHGAILRVAGVAEAGGAGNRGNRRRRRAGCAGSSGSAQRAVEVAWARTMWSTWSRRRCARWSNCAIRCRCAASGCAWPGDCRPRSSRLPNRRLQSPSWAAAGTSE